MNKTSNALRATLTQAWLVLLAVAAVATACDDAPAGDPPVEPAPVDPAAAFDATSADMDAFLAANGVPGAALAVVYDGTITTRPFGLRHIREPESLVTDDTYFHLFSITKSMTAAALMVLADRGALDLSAPVERLYGGFALANTPVAPITTPHLLTHTSGLPDDTPLTNASWSKCETSIEDHWAETIHTQWLETGRAHIYSNEGYNLAGAVLQELGDAPYPELVRTLVFDPLGMADIAFDNATVATRSWAHPHIRNDDGTLDVRDLDLHGCPFEAPSMGSMATAGTVARFARFLMSGDAAVLSDARRRSMMEPHAATLERPDSFYGYGLEQQTYKGLDVVFHSGRGLGTRAMMMMVPARGFAVVTLYNVQDADPYAVAFQAIDHYLAPEGIEPPAHWKTDPATWGGYAGTWESDGILDGTVTEVRAADRVLLASVLGGAFEVELRQVALDHFSGDFPGAGEVSIVFLRDAGGAVTHVLSRAGVGVKVR